ncbi:MAG: hypothetical protein PHD51_01655 [Patescibacteria group bacterium]|nr:hypothetical protein [Patescibacteria group bacterium]MDD5490432.1 hypothetical protein [Patescibacteria group bacterium]
MKNLFFLMLMMTFFSACAAPKTITYTYNGGNENVCAVRESAGKNELICTFFCPIGFKSESFTDAGSIICKKETPNDPTGVTLY